METKKLYQTSGGRILLTLKAIWQKFQKNTMWFWLATLVGFVALPRLPYLFSFDVEDLKVTSQIEKDIFERMLIVFFIFIGLIPRAFNKFVRHSKPMTFASIPANLWEKVTAFFAYILIALVGALVTTELTVIIDHLINPELRPLGLSLSTQWFFSNALKGQDEVMVFTLISSVILSFVSLLTYTAIRFKKALTGIAVGTAIALSVFFLLVSWMENFEAVRDFITGFEFSQVFYLAQSLLIVLEIGIIIAISRKLKTIED